MLSCLPSHLTVLNICNPKLHDHPQHCDQNTANPDQSQLKLRWDFTKTAEPVLPEVQGESECRLEAEQTVKQEARIRTKLLAILYLI